MTYKRENYCTFALTWGIGFLYAPVSLRPNDIQRRQPSESLGNAIVRRFHALGIIPKNLDQNGFKCGPLIQRQSVQQPYSGLVLNYALRGWIYICLIGTPMEIA